MAVNAVSHGHARLLCGAPESRRAGGRHPQHGAVNRGMLASISRQAGLTMLSSAPFWAESAGTARAMRSESGR
jgi:hypothetical protein